MRPRTPEISKETVIQKWLQAYSRNRIAQECSLGKGTVSAIINEWSQSTGKEVASQLRDLSLALRNSGLSLTQCVTGLRVGLSMKKLGIDVDDAEHFFGETYIACVSKGLEPLAVANLLEDVITLSDGLNSISAMFDQLRAIRDEKENRTNSTIELKENIKCLHAEREAAQELCEAALENDRVTQDTLKWFRDTREELSKYGIPVDDTIKFTKAVRWIRETGYAVMEIVKTYSDYLTMKNVTSNMQQTCSILEKDISGLGENKANLERLISLHSQTLAELKELARLGIGIKELRMLRSIIGEVAMANGLNTSDNSAWKKFFVDLEQYDTKLGFERKIQDHKVRLRKLIFLVNSLSEHLGMFVADSFQTKLGEQQKLLLANILDNHAEIAERVAATQIEQMNLNKRKENTKTSGRSYSHDIVNGDVVGFDSIGNEKQPSTDVSNPRVLTKDRESEPSYPPCSDEVIEEYYNYFMGEQRKMAASSESN